MSDKLTPEEQAEIEQRHAEAMRLFAAHDEGATEEFRMRPMKQGAEVSVILTAEELAEIEARHKSDTEYLEAMDSGQPKTIKDIGMLLAGHKAQAAEIERLTREMNEAHALIPSSSVELVSKNGEKRSLPWRIDMLMPAIAIGEKMLAKMVRGQKTIEGEFSELQARATAAEAKVAALTEILRSGVTEHDEHYGMATDKNHWSAKGHAALGAKP